MEEDHPVYDDVAQVPLPTANRVKERRLRRGLTQQEVDDLAGVRRSRCWRVERSIAVHPWELEAILAVLGASSEE